MDWVTKQCSGPCKRVLSVAGFAVDKTRPDGLTYWCRDCRNARWRRQYVPCVRQPRREDPVVQRQRFESLIDRSNQDGCWLWTGSRNEHGYGIFHANGKQILAHRYAYQLEHGEIPAGVLICHRCDVPACVKPADLFPGSQTDNMQDMASKGRGRKPLSARSMICPACNGTKSTYADYCRRCSNQGNRNPMYGRHHSDETRKIMSDAAIRRA